MKPPTSRSLLVRHRPCRLATPGTWLALRPWQRHSLVLAVAGCVYVAYGVATVATPTSPTRESGLRWALSLAPMPFWSTLFILAGLLALASTRWPPSSKTWGYTALSGLASLWSATYLAGVAFLDSPASGLSGALVWGLVAFLWWAIAGLMNPDDLFPPTPEEPANPDGEE